MKSLRVFLTLLSASAGSVLLMRWGLDRSTPDKDMRHVYRAVGRIERVATRLSAAFTRWRVLVRAALGFDTARWEYLRWKWERGDYALDT